jgi:cell division protein FtsL
MSYYYRGNLAVELERSRSQQKTKRTIRIKSSIPTGEKLLYLFFISLLVIGVGFVGVRYSRISQYNYEIQSLKKEIRLMQEKNAVLQLQIDQMSNRDRIISEAEKMGMVSNPDAVHVIGQTKGAAVKTKSGQTNP